MTQLSTHPVSSTSKKRRKPMADQGISPENKNTGNKNTADKNTADKHATDQDATENAAAEKTSGAAMTATHAAPRSKTSANHESGAQQRGWFILVAAIVLVAAGGGIIIATSGVLGGGAESQSTSANVIPAKYNGGRAFEYLKALCDLGPRPSGSAAMTRQQEILGKFFRDRGASVKMQTFEIRHPENGSDVSMANLIASWHPNRPKRFLICAHYDTRPYPDRDRFNQRGRFVGANDGASGTAGLMELANHLTDLPSDVGVDLVAFDAEEFIWESGRDKYFLGSTFFAEKYRTDPPAVPYRGGILLDMIGDRELKIYYERTSLTHARTLANSIWNTASRLRVHEFVARARHKLQDDHVPLNEIAKIPTVDIIDFDYPRVGATSYWHTEQDVPENCSGQSIAKVIWVVHTWLKQQ